MTYETTVVQITKLDMIKSQITCELKTNWVMVVGSHYLDPIDLLRYDCGIAYLALLRRD